MKILLYDTGDVRDELNEPIGIELLAAHLLKELDGQVSVDMKWFNFDGYSFDPAEYDLIGISIHINCLEVFDNIYKLCRQSSFKGLIVAGNSIASFAYTQLLNKYPDIICSIGEGEYTFKEIVKAYKSGRFVPHEIPNLAYMDNGEVFVSERKTFNIEEYIPPLRVFNDRLKAAGGIARIEASRGCAWNKCYFCGAEHKYDNTGWRPISIEIVIEQLIELSKAGITTIYFCDEDFIGNDSDRFAELVNNIQQKMNAGEISPDIKFFISVKPTDVISQKNIDIIERFMECGLADLFVGLESGCDAQLKRYNKCTNVKTNISAVNRIKELQKKGLTIDIGFIFFDCYMTEADVEDNISFIEENGLYKLASSLFKPLRIQPFTQSYKLTPEVHQTELSVDELKYDYNFTNSTVEQIYTSYSQIGFDDIAHQIQAVYRREMSSGSKRDLSEKLLTELRALQFSAIKAIASHYIRGEISELQLKNSLEQIKSNADALLVK